MASRQNKNGTNGALHFKTTAQSEIPQGRNGKHKLIVTTILKDLDELKAGSTLKIPLTEFDAFLYVLNASQ